MDNDFLINLVEYINSIGLSLKCRADYLDENEGLVVYSLPGGNVIEEDMAGNQTVELPFEVAIKTKNQQKANTFLWKINESLSSIGLDIQSSNGSYIFLNMNVNKPSLNDLDGQEYYIYLLDLTATIEIERK